MFRRLIRVVALGLLAICVVGAVFAKDRASELLSKIYIEVKEMGPHAGDPFIKRDFFVGEDDDDTNKDIHVSIVIHTGDAGERMNMLVAYMKRSRENRRLAFTSHSKSITCLVLEGEIHIQKSDYDGKEESRILSGILDAVLKKKKLLRIKFI